MEAAPAAPAPRGALGASCAHGDACCAHGSGAGAAGISGVSAASAARSAAASPPPARPLPDEWHGLLPWVCDLADLGNSSDGLLLSDPQLLCAGLLLPGEPGAPQPPGGALQGCIGGGGGGGGGERGGGEGVEGEGEAAAGGWLCRHVHTTGPPEQPGGRPTTTCEHTHVRVCKPGARRRGGAAGGGSAAPASAALKSGGAAGAAAAAAAAAASPAREVPAGAEHDGGGDSSGGDDAPPERKRNREAVRKYRARKKQEEGRAAAELAAARHVIAELSAENARLRALLTQVGALAAAADAGQ